MTKFMHLPIATALAVGAAVAAAAPQTPTSNNVYATGLEAPRGLRFGPDGDLYVAEAGLGGTNKTTSTECTQVSQPIGPYGGGNTGRISKVASNGKVTTVASGFASAQSAGGDLLGVADVAFVHGSLYALIAGGGCSHGNPTMPSGIALVDQKTGKWEMTANLSLFLKKHQAKFESADDFEPDGTFYSMLPVDGVLYTVEPNHGQIFSVTTDGKISEVIDISASQGHIVPTSIAHRWGHFYVGNLGLFPIDPQWARILTLSDDEFFHDPIPGFGPGRSDYHVVSSKAGFTTVVAVDFGPDGLLYALELSAAPGFPTPGAGKVVRVLPTGAIEDVVTGLVVPTGMTFGPDNRLYVSNLGAIPAGAAPPGSGQVLRFDIPPGPLGACRLVAHRQHRLFHIERGESPLEILDLGDVVPGNVRIGRMVEQIVLVIILRRVKTLERIHARDYCALEEVRLVELRDVGLGNPLLRRVGIKDR